MLLVACGNGNATGSGQLSGHTVMIDPGHGGRDPGSVEPNDVHEKDLITNTSDSIKKALRNAGANVIMTRKKMKKYR
ncbi:N-acetylmuramoyl-L-alanine amidase family protein [Virgibacillus pantothenticus]|uniref:N-acetylmuramoyl-L-alanine amidase family protein n=1 Tax=Virgibacillus pantothenticus TaxID=1473 RepID=UPI00098493D5|nr:N-acetylmuramoyl-L-alanine amidase [Virgibacillus pantothenticus]